MIRVAGASGATTGTLTDAPKISPDTGPAVLSVLTCRYANVNESE